MYKEILVSKTVKLVMFRDYDFWSKIMPKSDEIIFTAEPDDKFNKLAYIKNYDQLRVYLSKKIRTNNKGGV